MKPMAQVAEDFIFFLRKQDNGDRWPVGTKLYAEPVIPERLRNYIEYRMKTQMRGLDDVIHGVNGVAELRMSDLNTLADNLPQKEPVWRLKQKLKDLLDLYREETACVQYNGWFRQKHPDDIRKEIDVMIDQICN